MSGSLVTAWCLASHCIVHSRFVLKDDGSSVMSGGNDGCMMPSDCIVHSRFG